MLLPNLNILYKQRVDMQKLLLIVFLLTVVLITLITLNPNFYSKAIAQENGYDDYSYYNYENDGYVEGSNNFYYNNNYQNDGYFEEGFNDIDKLS